MLAGKVAGFAAVLAAGVCLPAPAGAFFDRPAPAGPAADSFEYGYTLDRPPDAAPAMVFMVPGGPVLQPGPEAGTPVYTPRGFRFQRGYPHTTPSTGFVRGYIYLPPAGEADEFPGGGKGDWGPPPY